MSLVSIIHIQRRVDNKTTPFRLIRVGLHYYKITTDVGGDDYLIPYTKKELKGFKDLDIDSSQNKATIRCICGSDKYSTFDTYGNKAEITCECDNIFTHVYIN